MGEDRDEVRLDSARLKAMAHPLRARILAALRADGPATASGMAERLATNSGQTSYHLRVLARAGLVEELPERGTTRERWWGSGHRSARIEVADVTDDPGAMERRRWLRSETAVLLDRAYARYLDEAERFDPDWQATAGTSDWLLPLTASELDDLRHEIEEVVERYADRRPPRRLTDQEVPPGVESVHVHLRAYPQRDVEPVHVHQRDLEPVSAHLRAYPQRDVDPS